MDDKIVTLIPNWSEETFNLLMQKVGPWCGVVTKDHGASGAGYALMIDTSGVEWTIPFGNQCSRGKLSEHLVFGNEHGCLEHDVVAEFCPDMTISRSYSWPFQTRSALPYFVEGTQDGNTITYAGQDYYRLGVNVLDEMGRIVFRVVGSEQSDQFTDPLDPQVPAGQNPNLPIPGDETTSNVTGGLIAIGLCVAGAVAAGVTYACWRAGKKGKYEVTAESDPAHQTALIGLDSSDPFQRKLAGIELATIKAQSEPLLNKLGARAEWFFSSLRSIISTSSTNDDDDNATELALITTDRDTIGTVGYSTQDIVTITGNLHPNLDITDLDSTDNWV